MGSFEHVPDMVMPDGRINTTGTATANYGTTQTTESVHRMVDVFLLAKLQKADDAKRAVAAVKILQAHHPEMDFAGLKLQEIKARFLDNEGMLTPTQHILYEELEQLVPTRRTSLDPVLRRTILCRDYTK
jgi:hypothetical protein